MVSRIYVGCSRFIMFFALKVNIYFFNVGLIMVYIIQALYYGLP